MATEVMQSDLMNMEFTPLEGSIEQYDWRQAVVQYKNGSEYYIVWQGQGVQKEEITDRLDGMFEGNRVWIAVFDNGEGFEPRMFVIVYDRDMRSLYTHYNVEYNNQFVKNDKETLQKFLLSVEDDYLKKKGYEIETIEDKVLSQVEVAFGFMGLHKGLHYRMAEDCRKKIVDEEVQVFSLSNRGTKKQWKEFFADIGLWDKEIPKYGLRYYPDGIVYTGQFNTNGNEKKLLIEVELGKHPRKDFLYKLKRIYKKAIPVYFIFSDYWYDYHIDLIEEFILNYKDKKEFKNIYTTKLSDFYSKGEYCFDKLT